MNKNGTGIDNCMRRFFAITLEALEEENRFLMNNFSKTNLYDKWHHGLSFLFETTLVYLVFRKLLEKDFPFEVIWEDSYTQMHSLKSDLTIVHSEALKDKIYIEFKIWRKETAEDIEADLIKLSPLIKKGERCFEFVLWRARKGEEETHLNYLENQKIFKDQLYLNTIECKHFDTKFVDNKLLEQITMSYMVALFEVGIGKDKFPYTETS